MAEIPQCGVDRLGMGQKKHHEAHIVKKAAHSHGEIPPPEHLRSSRTAPPSPNFGPDPSFPLTFLRWFLILLTNILRYNNHTTKFTCFKHIIQWIFVLPSLSRVIIVRAPLCLTSLLLHVLEPTRLLCPRDCQDKSTGVGCHFLTQEILLTQGSNSCLLHLQHCRQILYPVITTGWVAYNRNALFHSYGG